MLWRLASRVLHAACHGRRCIGFVCAASIATKCRRPCTAYTGEDRALAAGDAACPLLALCWAFLMCKFWLVLLDTHAP